MNQKDQDQQEAVSQWSVVDAHVRVARAATERARLLPASDAGLAVAYLGDAVHYLVTALGALNGPNPEHDPSRLMHPAARAEHFTAKAHALLAALADYENTHPGPEEGPCLKAALDAVHTIVAGLRE